MYAKELNISQVKLVDEVPQTEEREDEVDLEAHEVRGTSFVPFLRNIRTFAYHLHHYEQYARGSKHPC